MPEYRSTRFLGLTVPQAFLAGLVAMMLLLTMQTIVVLRLEALARQGAEAHAAECSYKLDLEQRLRSSEQFLRLSPAQREAKYGAGIGGIPVQTIKTSITNLRSATQSLDGLHC